MQSEDMYLASGPRERDTILRLCFVLKIGQEKNWIMNVPSQTVISLVITSRVYWCRIHYWCLIFAATGLLCRLKMTAGDLRLLFECRLRWWLHRPGCPSPGMENRTLGIFIDQPTQDQTMTGVENLLLILSTIKIIQDHCGHSRMKARLQLYSIKSNIWPLLFRKFDFHLCPSLMSI